MSYELLRVKKLWFVGLLAYLAAGNLSSQTLQPGPLLSFGIGLGFSTHASSYEVDELVRIKRYPGFRAYNLEARAGWVPTARLQVYALGRLSPSNSTISPYRALYAGGAVSYAFSDYLPFFVLAGGGFNQAKVNHGVKAGKGTLFNFGVGKYFTEKFFMEINVHFGKMQSYGEIEPDPFDDRETNVYVMLGYRVF